jgi:hypothetical protein
MKKVLYTTFILFCTIIYSCAPPKGEYKIYPLSPFTYEQKFSKDEDINKDFSSGLKTQYYIVDEDVDLTDKTRLRLKDFIETKLGADLANNKAIYFTFYKGTFTFSRNSVQTKEQLETEHAEQKLAEFEYRDGKLYNFDFFKDGAYYEQPEER